MKIKEIDEYLFSEFAKKHILKNFFQTKEYGKLMTYSQYNPIFIGGYINDDLVAASLILSKSIAPSIKYGYAPRGFLINYYDTSLLKEFTKKVKDYFFTKGYAFIKINPEVAFATVDLENRKKIVNTKSKELIDILKSSGYDKLKDNLYFESLLHKWTPVINLSTYNLNELDKDVKDEIKEIDEKGITLISGNENDIEKFYSFVENKNKKTIDYYKKLYEIFKKSDMVDLILLELDYDRYIKYLQRRYIKEQEINDEINTRFRNNSNNDDIYNDKMKSDKILNDISSDIALSNQKMQESFTKEVYGSALVIKYEGRVSIVISGQKNDFKMLNGSLPRSSWIVQFIRRNIKRDSLPLVILLRSSNLHSSRQQNVVVLK